MSGAAEKVRQGDLPEDFIDLYLGPDFCDVMRSKGDEAPVEDMYTGREAAAQRLYGECLRQYEQATHAEFSLRIDDTSLRATCIRDTDGHALFVLRRFKPIPELSSIGFDEIDRTILLSPKLEGLVLIAGRQGAGKTSTAASLLRERLRLHGGVAVAVEDPVEMALNGIHGRGRCMQVRVSPADGGFPMQVARALRTGSMQIMIGEVRTSESATEAVHASINGHLVITTLHAGSIPQAIERLCSLAAGNLGDAHSIVAQGLSAVIHQTTWSDEGGMVVVPQTLCLTGDDGSLRDRIRRQETSALESEIHLMARKRMWQ